MERSGSQKALLVFSIIEIILAALMFIGGVLITLGGGLIGAASSTDLADAGLTVEQAGAVGGVASIIGVLVIVVAIVALLCGIFGIRAANDANKVMPVWVFTLIELILSIVFIVVAVIDGSFGSQATSLVVSALFSLLMFWLANNIKNQRNLQ